MGKITSNSFEDLSTDIQNKSERDTKKNLSSEEHNSYEDSNEGQNSNYEPPQLLECSNRNFF